MYFGKTADSIVMPFGVERPVGPRNDVLDGGLTPKRMGKFWRKGGGAM